MLPRIFLPSVPWHDRASLPSEPGVYYCCRGWVFLYIGESKNLRERWTDNFGHGIHHRTMELHRAKCDRIYYFVCHDEIDRKQREAIDIRDFRTPLNRKLEPINRTMEILEALRLAYGMLGIASLFLYFLPTFFRFFSR